MGNNKKFLSLILIVFLPVVLIATFRVFLLPYVIEPIALLLWAFWRILSSVDQTIYWILLIITGALLVLRILPSVREERPNPAYNGRKKPPNRVEHWQNLIKEAPLGKDENKRLRESLEALLATVAAQEGTSGTSAIQAAIAKGENPRSLSMKRFPLFGPRWFRERVSKFIPQDNTLIDQTLRTMEIELELKHDNEP